MADIAIKVYLARATCNPLLIVITYMNNHKLYNIIRIAYTVFILVLIPMYLRQYGPANFLWFCDIAMFLVLIALWTRSNLLISMVGIGFIPLTIIWNISFFSRFILGYSLGGLANYMFDPTISLYVRFMSLFHIWLPCLLIWLLYNWGYNNRALFWSALSTFVVLPLTYMVTPEYVNINWVFGLNGHVQHTLNPLVYLALYTFSVPIFIYWPLHHLLKRAFHSKHSPKL